MILRTYVYLQVFAVAATGLASHWDRVGIPSGPARAMYEVGICCAHLVPVFPVALLVILQRTKVDRRQKCYAAIAGALAFVAHVIAAIPGIQ